jgi:hypothetical protein
LFEGHWAVGVHNRPPSFFLRVISTSTNPRNHDEAISETKARAKPGDSNPPPLGLPIRTGKYSYYIKPPMARAPGGVSFVAVTNAIGAFRSNPSHATQS